MVTHYQPGRLRYNSDRPTAITNVLVATSGSSYRTGEIPLGTPTCSARTRQGRWALYPNGDQAIVVWPGGALAGPPAEVAAELDRLDGGGHDHLAPSSAAGSVRNRRIAEAAAWSMGSWRSPSRRSSSPATSRGGPARAPPGQTTTTSVPWGYSAQRPWRVRAEQVGVPSGISPVRWDDPEVATRTSVIAVGWSLLRRSCAGG